MPRSALLLLWLCPVCLAADEKAPDKLPSQWHGTWKGTMLTTNAADKRSEVAVSLKIEPIKGTNDVTWVLTYGTGAKAMVKDYKLVAGKVAGRFRIDEGGGTALDARLVGGVLYSQFAGGGTLLTARYELKEGTLRFEVTSARTGEKTAGGKVQGYTVDVVQTAELKKGRPALKGGPKPRKPPGGSAG